MVSFLIFFCHVFLSRAFIIAMVVATRVRIGGEAEIRVNDGRQAENDGELIKQARDDPAAFAHLYRRHYDSVFRYCVHRLFERQTAEDVTSAVFLKVVENLGRFKGNQQQLRNWLYKIATNEVNDHLRRSARREGLLRAAREQLNWRTCRSDDSTNELVGKLAVLKEAMLTLKPRYQTIVTLRFFENLTLTEIAEVLGSNPGTIRSQLARALGKLRKRIVTAQHEE